MGIDAEMFVRVRPPLSEDRVRRLSYEAVSAFGTGKLWVDREHGRRPIYAVDRYEQDGPTLRPKKGEQFLRLSMWARYYGEGYERGDLPTIIMLAEWLEHRVRAEPGNESAEVWYGGDSSGVCAAPFGAKERLALFVHFVEVGHAPYRSGWSTDSALSRRCDFCDEPMRQYMFGGRDGFECEGCGLQEVTPDRGRTWEKQKPEARHKPPEADGATRWVQACLEHEDCRNSPELGVACLRKVSPSPGTEEK
jgi:hypothetical protein